MMTHCCEEAKRTRDTAHSIIRLIRICLDIFKILPFQISTGVRKMVLTRTYLLGQLSTSAGSEFRTSSDKTFTEPPRPDHIPGNTCDGSMCKLEETYIVFAQCCSQTMSNRIGMLKITSNDHCSPVESLYVIVNMTRVLSSNHNMHGLVVC